MMGRYGTDELYYLILSVCLILIIVNQFVTNVIANIIISSVEILLFAYSIYRVMSRNIYKRQAENMVFRKIINAIKEFFILQRNKHRDRKTHVYRRCPACKSTLRLPRQKGKHTAVCPRCERRFEVKIR